MGRHQSFCSLLAFAVACAGVPSKPVAVFPGRSELEALSAGKPFEVAGISPSATGDGWTLDGPFPDRVEDAAREATSGPERAIAEIARAHGATPSFTDALDCVAREVGRFMLETEALPGPGLRAFILGRCGTSLPDIVPQVVTGTAPTDLGEDALVAQWKEAVTQLVSRVSAAIAANAPLGVSVARKGQSVAIVLVGEPAEVLLDPVRREVGADGAVVIDGRVRGPVASVDGWVNRGRYSVASCTTDELIRLPSFRLRCITAENDASAWLEVVLRRPDRVLGNIVARLLVERQQESQQQGQPPRSEADAFHPLTLPSGVAQASMRSDPTFRMVEVLNRVRAELGLGALKIAEAQARTSQRLASPYFGATLTRDSSSDTIALGLLAGWEVDGMIRAGSFTSQAVSPATSPEEWLATTLMFPSGRMTMLDSEAEQIAVGALFSAQPPLVAALVTTYRFHHDTDHSSDVSRLLRRIDVARRERHLPERVGLDDLGGVLSDATEAIRTEERSPSRALEFVLASASRQLRAGVRGYVVETVDLDAIPLPDAILGTRKLKMAMAVTHHRASGAAWGQYVVLIVYADPGREV